MAIKPVSLPSAAGVDFGEGDVRHFSLGDAVDVPGMSNPTRYLAQRDNAVAEKLNEVIGVVNNQEQFVPFPVVRTIVPPNEEVIIANYRIPPGFESRILNAAVSASPTSTDIALNIYYASSFGNNTGTVVVTTASEFTGGVQFYQTGEFIITLKNTGPISLEMAASAMFTLRPVGAQGTLLVGTVIVGPTGPPGVAGPPGPPGVPGSGGAGSPGMVWQGAWTNGNSYNPNDVVSFALFGSITSSFICRVSNTASLGTNDPGTDDTVTWNAVALGGATGVGQQGVPGAILNAPVITFTPFNGTFITGDDFVAGDNTPDGYYGTNFGSGSDMVADGTYVNLSINEFKISSGTAAGNTIALVYGNPKLYFTGHGTVRLPGVGDGAAFNYTNSFIKVTVIDNGTSIPNVTVNGQTLISLGATQNETIVSTGVTSGTNVTTYGTYTGNTVTSYGTTTPSATVTNTHSVSIASITIPQSDFVVTVIDPNPVKIQLNIFGAQNA